MPESVERGVGMVDHFYQLAPDRGVGGGVVKRCDDRKDKTELFLKRQPDVGRPSEFLPAFFFFAAGLDKPVALFHQLPDSGYQAGKVKLGYLWGDVGGLKRLAKFFGPAQQFQHGHAVPSFEVRLGNVGHYLYRFGFGGIVYDSGHLQVFGEQSEQEAEFIRIFSQRLRFDVRRVAFQCAGIPCGQRHQVMIRLAQSDGLRVGGRVHLFEQQRREFQ